EREKGKLEVLHVHRLAGAGAAGHRVGVLHGADPVLERGAGDLLPAADGVDELLLDAPPDAGPGRHRDLAHRRLSAPAPVKTLRVALETQRALAAVDPGLRARREAGHRAESQVPD